MQRIFIYLLVMVIAGLSGLAIYQHRRISEQAARIAASEQAIAIGEKRAIDVQKSAEKLREHNAVFVEEATVLREKLAAIRAPEPAPGVFLPPETASEKLNPVATMVDKMMNDPNMADIFAEQEMVRIKSKYAEFVKQLNLTPNETKEFYELLAAQQAKFKESGIKWLEGDEKGAKEAADSRDHDLKAFLGSRYSQYESYEKTLADRSQLSRLTTHMAASQAPLRPDQANALLQIIQQEKLNSARTAQATRNFGNTSVDAKFMNDMVKAQEEENARILARSKMLLTPEQWTALGEEQKQSLEMQKRGSKMVERMKSLMPQPAN